MTDKDISTRPRRRTTLGDVAQRAGVSAVTVSRVLREPHLVSETLRERVATAASDLGYVPNRLASALASAQTNTIGVVVPSLTNGVFNDFLSALHNVFLPAGFQLLVLNSRYTDANEEKAIATLLGHHPEAMIVTGVDQTPGARRMLQHAGVPVVQVMELTDRPIDINIGLSQVEAGHAALRFLMERGCCRIAHLMAPLDARAVRRREAFEQEMVSRGMEPLVIASTRPTSVPLGAELLAALIERHPDVDAVWCSSDNLALGALFECDRRGIRVPEDISFMGFNDLEFCSIAHPAITSVATPRYEMGERTAEIVLEIIRGSGKRPEERRIDMGFEIRERDSTRKAPRP
ncbi:LacI family DNA-binding transcriptional regulator [Solirhodobacter olei]|uniref:LacI family DNA-binding transcriptional regulator n=1 Tax=Solirhodobacter olei TaxID=2493082 RepID=UPI000FDAAB5A|nr:LacI family DNA-binding transcriptional regulator [Solirhodobacter olei]